MNPELLVTYMASISAVTLVLVQLIKTGLIWPRMNPSPARDTLILALTYAFNFALLAVTLATRGEWSWSDLVLYLLAATNQSIASSGVHWLITTTQAGKAASDASASDASAPATPATPASFPPTGTG